MDVSCRRHNTQTMESASDRRFDVNYAAQLLLELAHEQSVESLLNRLVERAVERPHIVCAQIWLIEKGDLCATCPRRPVCPDQSRCLHLVAGKAKSAAGTGKGFGRLDPKTAREPLGVPPLGNVVLSGQQRAVSDVNAEPAPAFEPDWMREECIHGYAISPITFKGEALGAMVTGTRETFQEELRPWGNLLANQVGAAIANARTFEEIRVAGQRLEQTNRRLEQELAERQRVEDALRRANQELHTLRESERRYQELVEHANSIILHWQRDGRIIHLNEFGQRFFGYTDAEIRGRHVVGTIVPDTESRGRNLQALMKEISANPAAFEQNVNENLRRNGERVWIAWTNKVVLDGQGDVTEILSIGVDITERKRAEEALRRSEAYLAEGQRLSHTASWAWSPVTLQPLHWSAEMFRIYGFNPREGAPTAEAFWQRVHPEDLDRVRELLMSATQQGMEYEHEHRIVLPDGTVKHIHVIGHPVLAENGQLIEYVGTAMDVTERKLAEDELRKHQDHLEDLVEQRTQELAEAKARAEAANREKSRFLANMSHELRTPLNAVLGFSRLLKSGPEVTPRQQEALDIIVRSGEHLLNLINNVLDMAKIESGKLALEESDVDLHRLTHEVQSLLGVGAAEKGLRFTLELAPELPRFVSVDAGKLRQVLLNLVGNAIKYTEAGRVTLRASLAHAAQPGRAHLRFEVEDSGPGIGPEDCQRIFVPFVQVGTLASAPAGTGLGLAISKQYVELMGGRIGVESESGKGSVFQFTIPVSVRPSVTDPGEAPHGRVVGLAEGQPRHRLLIVEDQPENRLLLRRLLDPLGFEVHEAANGQEAVGLFEQWHPDLVWMDIRMPVMDGVEAVRRIRATKAGAEAKIIALTAHALEEERRPIMAAGCDDFVRKPFREQEIFDALARHLEVKFIYETARHPESASPPPGLALSPEQLEGLPAELLRELRQSVLELDTARTQALIAQVAERDPALGATLNTLATQLDYKRLLELLKREHRQADQTLCAKP